MAFRSKYVLLAVLVCAVATAALPAVSHAAQCGSSSPATVTGFDAPGDSELGISPELLALRISINAGCSISFAYDVAGQTAIVAGEFYSWFINSDNNLGTGSSGGFNGADFAIGMLDSGSTSVMRWNGATWVDATPIARSEVFGATANLSQIGAVSGTSILVAGGGSWTSSQTGNRYTDWLPDIGAPWAAITPIFNAGATPGGGAGGSGAKACVVPEVRGLSLNAATSKIRRANCRVGSVLRRKNRRYAGRVFRTSPSRGTRHPAGKSVSIFVGKRSGRRGHSSILVDSPELAQARIRAIDAAR